VTGIRRVIVGASGSPASLQALRYAEEPARTHDALLLPVLAWVPPGGDLADRRAPASWWIRPPAAGFRSARPATTSWPGCRTIRASRSTPGPEACWPSAAGPAAFGELAARHGIVLHELVARQASLEEAFMCPPRYSAAHGVRRLRFSLSRPNGHCCPDHRAAAIGATGSPVPCQRLRRAHATSTPGTARAARRPPPG
jgi:hypothetical protein